MKKVFTKYTLKALLTLAILASFATSVAAQTTAVTATVTDPNGVPYKNGSYFIQFSPNPSFPTAIYNVNGVPISTGPFSGPLDGTGTFTQSVADNGLTNPKGSSWIFTICNYGSNECFTSNIPVTGGTANLSTTLSANSTVLTGNATYNTSFAANARGIQIVGAGSQSADLIDIYDYSGLKFFSVDKNGVVFCLFGCGGGGGGGGITGTGNAGNLTEWNGSTSVQNAPILDLSTLLEVTVPYAINGPLMFPCNNAASGTTNGLLVTLDANGNCINLPNGQTGLIEGVQFSGGGTSGTGFIAKLGPAPVTFDNQTSINDYVVAGANGEAHDAGPTYPTGVQVLGVVRSANAGAGTQATAEISILNILSPAGSSGSTFQVNNVTTAGSAVNLNSTTPAAPTNNQNAVVQTDNGSPTSNVTVEIPQATASQAGIIQLTGDLGGTYNNPVVKQIEGIPCALNGTPVAGQVWGFTSSSACANIFLGVAPRTYSIATDTVLSTDRSNWIIPTTTGTVATTLPQAGTTGFGSNFVFAALNNATGTNTITPTTSTINGGASLAVLSKWFAITISDNTNYFAAVMPTALAFPTCPDSGGNHLNFGSSAGITCGTSGSGSSGYNQIDSNGTAIAQRSTVNFIPAGSANVSCVDNPGATRSDCTVTGIAGPPSPTVNTLTNTSYTVQNSDNTWRDVFTATSAIAVTLPQAGQVSVSPFVASRFNAGISCTGSCATTAYAQSSGDTMYIYLTWFDTSTITSLADTAGDSFVQVIAPIYNFDASHYNLAVYRVNSAIASASNTLTVTMSGAPGANVLDASVLEYTIASLDNSASNSNPAGITTASVNASNIDEMALAFTSGNGDTGCQSGWTSRDVHSGVRFACEKLVSSVANIAYQTQGGTTSALILTDVGITGVPTFSAGWYVTIENAGTNILTVTPTTSTINGQTTLLIVPNEACAIMSDGVNYNSVCFTLPNKQTNGVMGQKVEIAGVNTSNAAADVTITTLITTGASDAFYEVNAFADCRTSVAGTETVTITYTDTNSATQTFAATTGTCNASPAVAQITSSFRAKASTAISYTTTHTSTQPNYDVSVALYQLSTK